MAKINTAKTTSKLQGTRRALEWMRMQGMITDVDYAELDQLINDRLNGRPAGSPWGIE